MIGKDVRAKKDTQHLIGLACDPGTVALANGNERNSRHTAALLKQLPVPGRPIAMAMQAVRSEVLVSTGQAQRPWENSCLTEDVVLVPGESPRVRAATATAVAATAAEQAKREEAERVVEELRTADRARDAEMRRLQQQLNQARQAETMPPVVRPPGLCTLLFLLLLMRARHQEQHAPPAGERLEPRPARRVHLLALCTVLHPLNREAVAASLLRGTLPRSLPRWPCCLLVVACN
jgi:hypothetical protein